MNANTPKIILDTILSKQILDYIIFDRELRFVSGSSGIIRYLGAMPEAGESLIDYFPEFVGSEEEILDVFDKEYSLFTLDMLQKNNYYVHISIEYHDSTDAMILLRNTTTVSNVRQELMQNHNEVSLLLNMLQHIIDSQSALLFSVDGEGKIKFPNKRFREYFGVHDPRLYRYVNAGFKTYTELAQYLGDREEPITIGEDTFMIQSTCLESVYTLFTLSKVTTIFNENRQLLQKIKIDTLTGAYRKKVFEDRLDELMGVRATFAVVVADLDNFKKINDTYGHSAGDEVLRQFAAIIQEKMKGDELIARWGGEEFLVLLIERKEEDAFDRLQEMCQQIAAYDFGIGSRVTVSMGMSWRSECPCETADILLRRADHALYKAKNSGKNRVVSAESGDCKALCH
jgi:diguanylate cyclase (GGDEF)-like protein